MLENYFSLLLSFFVACIAILPLPVSAANFPENYAETQCSDPSLLKPDVCTMAECRSRQAKVHPTCDVQGGRTCNAGGQSLNEVWRRLNLNINCKAVRQAVAECFKKQDQFHFEQIRDAETSIGVCQYKFQQQYQRTQR